MLNAFITGSYAYGVPKENSDIDLVIRIDRPELQKLAVFSEGGELNEYDGVGRSVSLRFGKLNIIACTSDLQYRTWLQGTQQLINEEGFATRDYAVEVFKALRKAAGVG